MAEYYPGKERREFFRYRYEKPIHYTMIVTSKDKNTVSELFDAVSKNLSVSGMLFTSKFLPEISSIVVLDLDIRTLSICQEIEEHALIFKDRLVGKVVRIEDNDDNTYDVGIAFIRKTDSLAENIKKVIK